MTSTELIKRFYEEYREHFPEVSLEELKIICTAPFIMLKKTIQEGKLESVRLQYLFVAHVSPSRVIKNLNLLQNRKQQGKINQEELRDLSKRYLKYIEDNPSKFKKYESRIRSFKCIL